MRIELAQVIRDPLKEESSIILDGPVPAEWNRDNRSVVVELNSDIKIQEGDRVVAGKLPPGVVVDSVVTERTEGDRLRKTIHYRAGP